MFLPLRLESNGDFQEFLRSKVQVLHLCDFGWNWDEGFGSVAWRRAASWIKDLWAESNAACGWPGAQTVGGNTCNLGFIFAAFVCVLQVTGKQTAPDRPRLQADRRRRRVPMTRFNSSSGSSCIPTGRLVSGRLPAPAVPQCWNASLFLRFKGR